MGESQDLARLQSLVSCKYTILQGIKLFLTYCIKLITFNLLQTNSDKGSKQQCVILQQPHKFLVISNL